MAIPISKASTTARMQPTLSTTAPCPSPSLLTDLEQLPETGAAGRQQDPVRLHRVAAIAAEGDVQQLPVLAQLVKYGGQPRAEPVPAQTELLAARHRLGRGQVSKG